LDYDLSCTDQPLGIPLGPLGQLDIEADFTNVPAKATFESQEFVELFAEMLVAKHST
jgi:hypothetical protein